MDALGITVARWFEGLGWFTNIMRNMSLGDPARRLTPDSPTVLTLYIPFLNPGYEAAVQGQLGRAQLLGKSYADFELEIREQLTTMLGDHGFDARRDIAAIVLNRWGHAFLAPGPGMFFGTETYASPLDTVRQPFGRIFFAHSELQGNMNMAHAMLEGRRGAHEALAVL
jgi:spermidine dehydrogenase